MFRRWKAESESGQIVVIVAAGLVVMIAMVGLVIDGGYAWGQQRDTQNASDAAAEAGTVRLAENLPFLAADEAPPNDNADVAAAVLATADANGVEVDEAWYVDFDGDRTGGAPLIGEASLPTAALPPAGVDGVEVTGTKTFDTFLGQIIGISEMTAKTKGTAVTGYVDVVASGVLPVTFPLNVTFCTNQNKVFKDPGAQQWTPDQDYVVPLCANGPGNVGWLDWDPPSGQDDPNYTSECEQGNGNKELECAILTPDNPRIETPEWYFVASTGNLSAAYIEDALMTHAPGDKVIIIPIFDATCEEEPEGADKDACEVGEGNGQNQWYHLAGWAGFDIEWVDLNGGASGVCESGNGATGCFKGQFKYFGGLPDGTLEEAQGNESLWEIVDVRLIDSK